MPDAATQPLAKAQAALLIALLFLVVVLGGIVELRSAFQHVRKTDADVYFTAAWAVRTGADPYRVTDSHGWHYWYPPPLAILLAPLADPPPGQPRVWALPYVVAIGVWYVLSVAAAALGAHLLASALEATSLDPAMRTQPRFCRRWWALRIWPLIICASGVLQSLTRGQVGCFLLLLLAGAAGAMLRRRSFQAGLWLAGAICLKMIPVLLILVPLMRRDWRMLGGTAAGLLIGLGLIPLIALGPTRTADIYRSFSQEALLPTGNDPDAAINRELFVVTPTDSNSPWLVFHNWLHPQVSTRPNVAGQGVHVAHDLLAVALIVVTLFAGARPPLHPWRDAVLLATLALVMIVVSPVFHTHYFAIAPLLVMPLLARDWEARGSMAPTPEWICLTVLLLIAFLIPGIDALHPVRNMGFPLLASLALWGVAIVTLRRMEIDGMGAMLSSS